MRIRMMEYYSWKNLNVQVKERKSSHLEQQKKNRELSATRTVLRNCSLHHWVDFQPRVAGSCSPLWSLPKLSVILRRRSTMFFFSAGRKGVSNGIIFNTEWSEKGVWKLQIMLDMLISFEGSCKLFIVVHHVIHTSTFIIVSQFDLRRWLTTAQDAQKGFTPGEIQKCAWMSSQRAGLSMR